MQLKLGVCRESESRLTILIDQGAKSRSELDVAPSSQPPPSSSLTVRSRSTKSSGSTHYTVNANKSRDRLARSTSPHVSLLFDASSTLSLNDRHSHGFAPWLTCYSSPCSTLPLFPRSIFLLSDASTSSDEQTSDSKHSRHGHRWSTQEEACKEISSEYSRKRQWRYNSRRNNSWTREILEERTQRVSPNFSPLLAYLPY